MRRLRLAPHPQRHFPALLGVFLCDLTHGERGLDAWAVAAAGDFADPLAVAVGDFGMLAGRRASHRRQADAFARDPIGKLPLDDRGAGKAAFLAAAAGDRPCQIGFDGRRGGVDVMAMEA